MKKLLFALFFLNFNAHAFLNVCQRSPDAIRLIEAITSKRCAQITQEDLLSVERIDAASWGLAPLREMRNFDLSYMPNLHWLNLSNQRLTSLPENLLGGRHDKLMVLNLSNNQMTMIPFTLTIKLPALTTFIMNDNRVTSLESRIFHQNHNLQYLSLKGNLIESIPDGLFRMANLFILALENNRISCIPENLLQGQHNLAAIYLSNNQIYNLPSNIFDNNSSIELIEITGNPVIDLLTPEMRERLPNFVEIYQ